MSDETISEALGINPPEKKAPIEIKTNNTEPVASTFEQRKRDYQTVRDNLKHIIETSGVAIDGILNVASEGESPRAYEVVSQLIKTTLEANESLIGLHKTIKDIEKEEDKGENATHVTNNALYVGSTKDLLQMIKGSDEPKAYIDVTAEETQHEIE
jgi:hypothetical protein